MSSVSVLVSSYDGFSFCWDPFAHGLTKYWPDCPYPVYLITNFKDFQSGRVSALKVGKDEGWSENLLKALDQIDTPYILYFQEDYWLKGRVDTRRIEEYVSLLERRGGSYLRLVALPGPDWACPPDERFGVIAPDAQYRASLQVSLWRKDVLCGLVARGENAWDFEDKGSVRSRKYGDTFLSVWGHKGDPFYFGVNYVCTAVERGRWIKAAKDYARAELIDVDFGAIPSEGWFDEFKRQHRRAGRAADFFFRNAKLIVHRAKLICFQPSLAARKASGRIRRLRA